MTPNGLARPSLSPWPISCPKRGRAGLRNKYSESGDFKLRVRSFPALAFLKVADAVPAFEQPEMLPQVDEIQPAPPHPSARALAQIARFIPFAFSNVPGRCDSGSRSTNNAADGYHQGFADSLARADHPNMWRVLTALQRQQATTRLDMASVLVGNEKKPTRPQRETYERILALMGKYLSGKNDAPKS